MAPELSVIIVTWNCAQQAEACLQSLSRFYPDGEVIVVDNASADLDALHVSCARYGATLLAQQDNLGFAAGNNVGARHAHGRDLLFLNPDTYFTDDSLPRALQAFAQLRPHYGALGCRLLGEDGALQKSCSFFPTAGREVLDKFYLSRLLPQGLRTRLSLPNRNYARSGPADWIMGAFVLVGREDFERAGGWTEDYFMYGEDMDLCFKLNRLGRPVYYWAGGSVVHAHNVSAAKRYGDRRIVRVIASTRLFLQKYGTQGRAARIRRINLVSFRLKRLACRLTGRHDAAKYYGTCIAAWREELSALLAQDA